MPESKNEETTMTQEFIKRVQALSEEYGICYFLSVSANDGGPCSSLFNSTQGISPHDFKALVQSSVIGSRAAVEHVCGKMAPMAWEALLNIVEDNIVQIQELKDGDDFHAQ